MNQICHRVLYMVFFKYNYVEERMTKKLVLMNIETAERSNKY